MKTTTIQLSEGNKVRLASILKKGETYEFGIELLLLHFAKPRFGAGGAFGNRTVYPPFSKEELKQIRKRLNVNSVGLPMKTPKEINKELTGE